LLGDALQAAVAQVAAADVELRKGLPVNWTNAFGSGRALILDAGDKSKAKKGGGAAAAARCASAAAPRIREEMSAHVARLLQVRPNYDIAAAPIPTSPPDLFGHALCR
jgi:hypothetical protein